MTPKEKDDLFQEFMDRIRRGPAARGVLRHRDLADAGPGDGLHLGGPGTKAGMVALGMATSAEVDADIATHTAIAAAHQALVTLAADADTLLGLTGQQLTLDSQTANLVFAGPGSGGAADPTFRALVDADIPSAIARDAEVTSAVSTHEAAGDPHTGYALESATPGVSAHGRADAQVAAVATVTTFTVGAADRTFLVMANVLVTTATTHNFTVEVAYTDESNTPRVLTMTFSQLAGTQLTAITNVTGAGPYEGIPLCIRAKAGTPITINTQAAGVYTAVVFNVDGSIIQVA